MKTMFKIAKTELYSLFFSPVAWLVLIIFTFQSGITFANIIERYVMYQGVGAGRDMLTSEVFTGPYGFLTNVLQTLYLYIPLLTMGLISRELSSGSIKLLLSSPIKLREIILGKYLAMLCFCLMLIVILLLYIFVGSYCIKSPDYKLLVSGLIGFYLLIAVYSAIGLFMSCLSSYQVVAAISTLVVLAILNLIGSVDQSVAWVRTLTYFLSLSGRSDILIDGLVRSMDIAYFLIIIGFFLKLAIMVLQAGREKKASFLVYARYTVLAGTVLFLGYVSSRPQFTGYYDMTVTKSNTLTKNSQEIIKKIKGPLTITAYINILDRNSFWGFPVSRNNDLNFWEEYRRFLPEMQLNYVYYYDSSDNQSLFRDNPGQSLQELARKVSDSYGMDMDMFLAPTQIKKIIDLSPEGKRSVRQISLGSKSTFLRMFNDRYHQPQDAEIVAALKRLVIQPPKILFLTGNNERSIYRSDDNGYKMATADQTFRHSLVNQGFDVDTFALGNQAIPDSIAALVIADPGLDFKPKEIREIQRYIEGGGNLLIAGEPRNKRILAPLLEELGLQFSNSFLVEDSKEFPPDFVLANYSPDATRCMEIEDEKYPVAMVGASGIVAEKGVSEFKQCPILVSNGRNTWNRPWGTQIDSGEVVFEPSRGDEKGVFPLAIALTRNRPGKQQRIMVLGDADFMTNETLRRDNPQTSNFSFTENIFKWFSDGEFPINTERPKSNDNKMLITRKDVGLIRILFLLIIPVILLFSGALLLMKRRRK